MEPKDKRSKIIEQIHNLSRLTSSNGAFEGEISNASVLMQRLIEKYSISPEEIASIGNKEIDEAFESKKSDAMFGSILNWHWQLARVIARITHTRHFSSGQHMENGKTLKGDKREYGKTISFYGRETNAKIAADLMQEWLLKLTEMAVAATSKYCKELLEEHHENYPNSSIKNAYHIPNLKEAHPNIFRSSWLAGCLRAMSDAVYAQEKEREQNATNALAIYDEKIAEMWNRFSRGFGKTTTAGNRNINTAGYMAGVSTGMNLHIGQKEIK